MSDETPAEAATRFNVRTVAETHFAWLRTRLAIERTIMAWVRTAVSLIAFGFTIVQFFDRMQDFPGSAPARFPDAPRYLGLALIACGIASLAISAWQYQWSVNYLWGEDYAKIAGMKEKRGISPILGVIAVLALVGLFAFFSVLLRLI